MQKKLTPSAFKEHIMIKEVTLPKISDNVDSGQVVDVLVDVGDSVDEEQSLIELETDKATFEVPSPIKGKISEIDIHKGDEIKTGQMIMKIDTEQEE
jgi:pyruvate dehydrogenase E2 component (dihydrolipoamide acetyltransferase)